MSATSWAAKASPPLHGFFGSGGLLDTSVVLKIHLTNVQQGYPVLRHPILSNVLRGFIPTGVRHSKGVVRVSDDDQKFRNKLLDPGGAFLLQG